MKKILFSISILFFLSLDSFSQSMEAGFSYSGSTRIAFYNSYGVNYSLNKRISENWVVGLKGEYNYSNQYYIESFLPDTFMFGVPDPYAYRWVTTQTHLFSISSSLRYKLLKVDNFSFLIGPVISWNYLRGNQHYEIYSDTYYTPQYFKFGAGLSFQFNFDQLFHENIGLYSSFEPWYLFSSKPLGGKAYDPFVNSIGFMKFGLGISYKI